MPGKTKSGLQDFASLRTLKGFIPQCDSKQYETNENDDFRRTRGLSRATLNQVQHRSNKLGMCDCRLSANESLLLGWELYKPRKFYANSNQRSRSNSTEVLRHLLIDHIDKKGAHAHGKPTALMRLIDGMKKPPPKPKYEYGNCLQQTMTFDEHKMKYGFEGKLKFSPPAIDDVYLNPVGQGKPLRKNPFAEIQLCPKSLYALTEQPPGREYDYRGNSLLDPKTWQNFGLQLATKETPAD